MSVNVETMFSVREKPWHGLRTVVTEAPDSASALGLAGLDWSMLQKALRPPTAGTSFRDSRQTSAMSTEASWES